MLLRQKGLAVVGSSIWNERNPGLRGPLAGRSKKFHFDLTVVLGSRNLEMLEHCRIHLAWGQRNQTTPPGKRYPRLAVRIPASSFHGYCFWPIVES